MPGKEAPASMPWGHKPGTRPATRRVLLRCRASTLQKASQMNKGFPVGLDPIPEQGNRPGGRLVAHGRPGCGEAWHASRNTTGELSALPLCRNGIFDERFSSATGRPGRENVQGAGNGRGCRFFTPSVQRLLSYLQKRGHRISRRHAGVSPQPLQCPRSARGRFAAGGAPLPPDLQLHRELVRHKAVVRGRSRAGRASRWVSRDKPLLLLRPAQEAKSSEADLHVGEAFLAGRPISRAGAGEASSKGNFSL